MCTLYTLKVSISARVTFMVVRLLVAKPLDRSKIKDPELHLGKRTVKI